MPGEYSSTGALIQETIRMDDIPVATLRPNGSTACHHKRIYRLMSQNGMLLQRYTGRPPTRAHDGQVRTLKPNMRWTSDGFEIPCWNGEAVRVVFALDTCDREAMSWKASTGGVTGGMVRDLMVESVEHRFGDNPLPHAVQWLSDNGSCYRAHETVNFAISLGFSYVHDRPDAQTVLSQLPAWFEDYNESHPHKGLRMRSPREFIRSYATAACPV